MYSYKSTLYFDQNWYMLWWMLMSINKNLDIDNWEV